MISITDLEKFYSTDEVRTFELNKLWFDVIVGECVGLVGG